MDCQKKYKCILLFVLLLPVVAGAQRIYFVKGKKAFPFPTEHAARAKIGVYTERDTLMYNESLEAGWEVRWATVDSFQVQRPVRMVDTVVLRNSGRYPQGYQYTRDFKKDGVKYTLITKVLEYEYRVFAFNDVRKLKYTTYSGNGSGCVGCFFIPVFNVAFLIWAVHRWDAREVEVGEWKREAHLR